MSVMRTLRAGLVFTLCWWLGTLVVLAAPAATPGSLILRTGQSSGIAISGATGTVTVSSSSPAVASATYANGVVTVNALSAGTTTVRVSDATGTNGRAYVGVTIVSASSVGNSFAVLAWNDLGMHCMDADYSVFSILPPFNNLHVQLVDKSGTGLVTSNVVMSFEAMADATGSVNSGSANKTNFWTYVPSLFGVSLPPNVGLTGYGTASFTPQALKLDAASAMYFADGIPLTPIDDAGRHNTYPMVKVVARNNLGQPLAEAHVVLPVSDEMTCVACHGSSAGPAARPALGWVNDPSPERDYRRNVLRLHDDRHLPQWNYKLALRKAGYDLGGLLATADRGKPVLCAACHSSNALPGTGVAGLSPLTQAMHTRHASSVDPSTGLALNSSTNRSACYNCHPGSATQCLRGAMGKATLTDGSLAMQCQSCHGGMTQVGRVGRTGWLEQPNCQSCHHDAQREVSALDANGNLKVWSDQRFASNPNTPTNNISLYRFSKGHGQLQCEACHGATHAEYPSLHANDNVLSQELQGHTGTVAECTACHSTTPLTYGDGPHGMHSVGSLWVTNHRNFAESASKRAQCTTCHGKDYRGSVLSKTFTARSFSQHSYRAGDMVTCYDCHNGPSGD